ncbi:MAG TPA: hypothetical protein VHE58_07910 [Burkholderiales bacterium]|nr:hypothetical protein [Burkholderiales bacterium]
MPLVRISAKANPRIVRVKPLFGDRSQSTDKTMALADTASMKRETMIA